MTDLTNFNTETLSQKQLNVFAYDYYTDYTIGQWFPIGFQSGYHVNVVETSCHSF